MQVNNCVWNYLSKDMQRKIKKTDMSLYHYFCDNTLNDLSSLTLAVVMGNMNYVKDNLIEYEYTTLPGGRKFDPAMIAMYRNDIAMNLVFAEDDSSEADYFMVFTNRPLEVELYQECHGNWMSQLKLWNILSLEQKLSINITKHPLAKKAANDEALSVAQWKILLDFDNVETMFQTQYFMDTEDFKLYNAVLSNKDLPEQLHTDLFEYMFRYLDTEVKAELIMENAEVFHHIRSPIFARMLINNGFITTTPNYYGEMAVETMEDYSIFLELYYEYLSLLETRTETETVIMQIMACEPGQEKNLFMTNHSVTTMVRTPSNFFPVISALQVAKTKECVKQIVKTSKGQYCPVTDPNNVQFKGGYVDLYGYISSICTYYPNGDMDSVEQMNFDKSINTNYIGYDQYDNDIVDEYDYNDRLYTDMYWTSIYGQCNYDYTTDSFKPEVDDHTYTYYTHVTDEEADCQNKLLDKFRNDVFPELERKISLRSGYDMWKEYANNIGKGQVLQKLSNKHFNKKKMLDFYFHKWVDRTRIFKLMEWGFDYLAKNSEFSRQSTICDTRNPKKMKLDNNLGKDDIAQSKTVMGVKVYNKPFDESIEVEPDRMEDEVMKVPPNSPAVLAPKLKEEALREVATELVDTMIKEAIQNINDINDFEFVDGDELKS